MIDEMEEILTTIANRIDDSDNDAEPLSIVQLSCNQMFATIETELAGHMVVMGILICIDESMLSIRSSFTVCSKSDRYKREIGNSIAIGRLVCRSDYDVTLNGSFDKTESLFSYTLTELQSIENLLVQRNFAEKAVKNLQSGIHAQFGEVFTEISGQYPL